MRRSQRRLAHLNVDSQVNSRKNVRSRDVKRKNSEISAAHALNEINNHVQDHMNDDFSNSDQISIDRSDFDLKKKNQQKYADMETSKETFSGKLKIEQSKGVPSFESNDSSLTLIAVLPNAKKKLNVKVVFGKDYNFDFQEKDELTNKEFPKILAASAHTKNGTKSEKETSPERVLPMRRSRMAAEAVLSQALPPTKVTSQTKKRVKNTIQLKQKKIFAPTSSETNDAAEDGGDNVVFTLENASEKRQSRLRGGESDLSTFIGEDGNLYYCHYCKEVGEVVCCDGCPKVFHIACIPEGSSKKSLENDDDPWFCPECFDSKIHKKKEQDEEKRAHVKLPRETSKRNSSYAVRVRNERRFKTKCSECKKSGGRMSRCKHCSVFLHTPSCIEAMQGNDPSIVDEDEENVDMNNSFVVCTNCRAQCVVENEEEELSAAVEQKKRDDEQMDQDSVAQDDESGKSPLSIIETNSFHDQNSKSDKSNSVKDNDETIGLLAKATRLEKKLKNKKKKLKEVNGWTKKIEKLKNSESCTIQMDIASDHNKRDHMPSTNLVLNTSKPSFTEDFNRPVKLVPAFFFYLLDARFKIEKSILRKNPDFRNIPRSLERNIVVAKEGSLWWSKLSNIDKKKWEEISIKDFEERVVEWRENKIVEQMKCDLSFESDLDVENSLDVFTMSANHCSQTLSHEKKKQSNFIKFQLNEATIIPSEANPVTVKVESSKSTLHELLQDSRFHPIPMMHSSRNRNDFDFPDFSKMTLPFFHLQGPVSTYVGDECLGCSRGWCHFCPVLKRKFPAVEYRSKLQPPLSSLMATRISLKSNLEEGAMMSNAHQSSISLPLSQPSQRMDDISQFITEAILMKIPSKYIRYNAQSNKDIVVVGDDGIGQTNLDKTYKCGLCNSIVFTSHGCLSCRRSLFINEIAKRKPVIAKAASSTLKENQFNGVEREKKSMANSETSAQFLKMQTVMIGRASLKRSDFRKQREGDKAIAAAMTGPDWKPNVIMPMKTSNLLSVPGFSAPGKRKAKDEYLNENGDEQGIESNEMNSRVRKSNDNSISPRKSNKRPRVTILDIPEKKEIMKQPPRRLSCRKAAKLSTNSDQPNGLSINELMNDTDYPDFRQVLARAHKMEADGLHKKCLSYAIAGVFLGLMRRDPLRLFYEPVPGSIENYHKLVPYPMDFKTIRKKCLSNDYCSFGAFISDARLLCNNAIIFNPPGSIYYNTAKEIAETLEIMHKRASSWMAAIKKAHASYYSKSQKERNMDNSDGAERTDSDPFSGLRKAWPDAVHLLENGSFLMQQIRTDFIRTKENEAAYYGALAVRRASIAAAVSLSSSSDITTIHKPCPIRTTKEDELLRRKIDERVSTLSDPINILNESGWREESILQVLRKVQSRRVEGRIASRSGCARCEGTLVKNETKLVLKAEAFCESSSPENRSFIDATKTSNIAESRLGLSTGLGSRRTREVMPKVVPDRTTLPTDDNDLSTLGSGVSVQGSPIHGWGLLADHPFQKGEVVAEYVGEYIRNTIADKREKNYQKRRIQDYQFRVADNLVIDATLDGGYARYINHSCQPNCFAKIINGKNPNEHLKRVIIVSQRDIKAKEEITYDYQFPLELDLNARIPCNCGSNECRGFMNWDLPEKVSNRVQSKDW